jgi:hypothetical protein
MAAAILEIIAGVGEHWHQIIVNNDNFLKQLKELEDRAMTAVEANQELDKTQKRLAVVKTELADAEKKLNDANQALDALKAKL